MAVFQRYESSDFANGIASERVGEIVTAINPVESKNVVTTALSVLTAAFAFLDLPMEAIADGAIIATTSTGKAIAIAIEQSSRVLKALQQPATIDGEFNDINDIENTPSKVVQSFQAKVANVLAALQPDVNSFLAFAANSSIMVSQPSLNASTGILTQILIIYITS